MIRRTNQKTMTVDFATYCCSKDIDKLEAAYNEHAESHGYNFDNRFLIYQRCEPKTAIGDKETVIIKEEQYDEILLSARINPDNKQADEYTHGWDQPHYWRHHCVNHITAMNHSDADYIVLSDADCYIKHQRGRSWVEEGIDILKRDRSVLLISPSDGTDIPQKMQRMSQQLFLCERQRLMEINFDLPFKGFVYGGPMAEYYFMLEGRIGRYMEHNNLYRYMLGADHRYWHSAW